MSVEGLAAVPAAAPQSQGNGSAASRKAGLLTGSAEVVTAPNQRAAELAALYDFTERLQHTGALGEVCHAGLDAIQQALRCPRAAILLKDAAGVMRFATWRALSDAYRRAVEGHSPWSPDAARPDPICIADVAVADLPAPIRAAVDGEGIRAVAFIPLVVAGRLVGKFMAYYDTPHDFTPGEVEIGLTLGRQLAFGVERSRAEETRRASERAAQHLAAIVESSDDAIISKDLDGVIMTWNRGAERLFGYTAEEAIGRPVTLLIPPERLDEEPGILRRIRSGERIEHYETLRRRKDGRLIDISLTISPMRDSTGRIVGASKIARDITARRLANQRVRDSEQRLRDLMAAIPAAIYTTDAAGKITYFNEQAVALAGRTPEIGSDEWCVTWKLFQPDGTPLPHDQCPMAVALKEGRPIRDAEAVAERPDGSRVPFIPYPTPLRDSSGKVVGAINMLVDISERKQAETQQRLLLAELNHRVKNNMQMLQSLLVTAAHQTENEEAQQVLAEASNRLSAMSAAQRVLYVTTNATRFGAGDFLDAVCQSVQYALPKSIRLDWRADPIELSNDAAMPLALILNELATNAVKHGLKDRTDGVVRIGLTRARAESLLLYVEDDGPGFDLDQARSHLSGLRLVQGLARQLRGRFEVSRGAATRCSLYFS